jgi:hypothetical protein
MEGDGELNSGTPTDPKTNAIPSHLICEQHQKDDTPLGDPVEGPCGSELDRAGQDIGRGRETMRLVFYCIYTCAKYL